MQSLDLSSCSNINHQTLINVLKLLPNLKDLDISGYAQLNDTGIDTLILIHQLQSISFACCTGISSTALGSFFEQTHSKLEKVPFSITFRGNVHSIWLLH